MDFTLQFSSLKKLLHGHIGGYIGRFLDIKHKDVFHLCQGFNSMGCLAPVTPVANTPRQEHVN